MFFVVVVTNICIPSLAPRGNPQGDEGQERARRGHGKGGTPRTFACRQGAAAAATRTLGNVPIERGQQAKTSNVKQIHKGGRTVRSTSLEGVQGGWD